MFWKPNEEIIATIHFSVLADGKESDHPPKNSAEDFQKKTQWPKPEHLWLGSIAIWIINVAMYLQHVDLHRRPIRDMGDLQRRIQRIPDTAEPRIIDGTRGAHHPTGCN